MSDQGVDLDKAAQQRWSGLTQIRVEALHAASRVASSGSIGGVGATTTAEAVLWVAYQFEDYLRYGRGKTR